ncbi:hypothetical protein ACFWYW_55600 [Nonomuraea sp. NPDC059023]|uniref:hypothetical protein n=1 Tax=unclassified Nonomuraea TaxID=2593643 RepID=UPI00369DD1CE
MSETAPEIDADVEQTLAEAIETVEPSETPEQAEPDKGAVKPGPTAADVAKWKALARKHETAAKANADAAKRLAEYEDAQKTEQQRMQDRAQSAEKQLAALTAQNARLMAATVHGIPAELIDLLGDGTEEQINERAELLAAKLAAVVPPVAPAAPPQTRPVESLKPGAAPGGSDPDPDAWLRSLAHRT